MNPAALKMNIADLKPNGILIVNLNDFGELDLRKAQMTVEPARGSFARRLSPVSRRAHQAHARRSERSGPRQQERRPLQEFLRARHVLLALQPVDGQHPSLDRREIQEQAATRPGQSHGHAGRLQLLRSHRSVSDQLRNSAGKARARRLSQHQRKHRAGDGICGRFAEGGHSAVSSAPIRSRPLPTFCTSFPPTRISA